VSGARIELKASGNYYTTPILAQTTVGTDGKFILEIPQAGNYMIYAVAPSNEYLGWAGRSIAISGGATIDAGDFYLSKKLQLLEPANNAIVNTTTPTLRWSSFLGATRYHVDVFNGATGQAVMRQDTTGTSLVVTPALTRGVRYEWSVDAYNTNNIQIAYYSPWYFSVQP